MGLYVVEPPLRYPAALLRGSSLIGAITALWLKRGIDWQKSRGHGLEKHYMEEYGFMDDKDNKL